MINKLIGDPYWDELKELIKVFFENNIKGDFYYCNSKFKKNAILMELVCEMICIKCNGKDEQCQFKVSQSLNKKDKTKRISIDECFLLINYINFNTLKNKIGTCIDKEISHCVDINVDELVKTNIINEDLDKYENLNDIYNFCNEIYKFKKENEK